MRILSIAAIACFLSVFTSTTAISQDNADAIVGVWKNGEGTGIIKIVKNGDKYQGRIVWLKEPNDPETGKPKLDKNHPDAANHSRPVLGLTNMWGFEYKGKSLWDGGKIYDPKNGNTYDCTIKLKDANTLDVRGYIGVSLIGRTDVWTRQVAK